MSVLDLFWLFFILSALQPVLRQRMMEAMRTRKIAQLERARNSRVILLVHRQETMKFLGFPVMRYRCERLRGGASGDSPYRRRGSARHHLAYAGRALSH
jgi:ClpP class serine protease